MPLQARGATPERCTFRHSHSATPRSASATLTALSSFFQLLLGYPSGTLILAIPGQRSSLFCTRFGHLVCLASVTCRTFFRRRRPFCAKPALPCNRAAAGQSMRGLGNKDCLDHRAARAAARETFQDETRLEQRFRVAPCGERRRC